jgi:hypothetical protein
MTGDARAAYLADLRGRYRWTQNAAYIACLVGVLVMLTGRYGANAPHWLIFLGLGIIIIGWGLLATAIFGRAAYVRAHPFEPND